MSTKPPGHQRGLSLIELIIFMVVMGITAVAVLQMLNLSAKSSADPVRRKQALLLAESYLEEVELARFTYCDPTDPAATTAANTGQCAKPEVLGQETGGVGRPFDNVSDYGALGSPGAALQQFLTGGQLSDASGTVLTGLSGFTVTVALNAVPVATPLGTVAMPVNSSVSAANMRALRITVSVFFGTDPTNPTHYVVLDGYRTRYAPNSVP
jgi:MSHA pilin protein MshD